MRVHGGFRSQYYGKVTKDPCTDGKVPDELRAAPGEMVGKVLEDALFQKVSAQHMWKEPRPVDCTSCYLLCQR